MITADDLKRVLAEWDAGSLSRAELDGVIHAIPHGISAKRVT